jgi:hypothetical protein
VPTGPSGACAAGEAKLTAARFYQLITSNLEGQKSLAPVRAGKSVLSAGVGKEMADIALMVHWHMARMISKLCYIRVVRFIIALLTYMLPLRTMVF